MLPSSNQSATILVVEDERAVARELIYGLREEGFTIEWAETGRAAMALVDQLITRGNLPRSHPGILSSKEGVRPVDLSLLEWLHLYGTAA